MELAAALGDLAADERSHEQDWFARFVAACLDQGRRCEPICGFDRRSKSVFVMIDQEIEYGVAPAALASCRRANADLDSRASLQSPASSMQNVLFRGGHPILWTRLVHYFRLYTYREQVEIVNKCFSRRALRSYLAARQIALVNAPSPATSQTASRAHFQFGAGALHPNERSPYWPMFERSISW